MRNPALNNVIGFRPKVTADVGTHVRTCARSTLAEQEVTVLDGRWLVRDGLIVVAAILGTGVG